MLDRPGAEEGSHEGELIELAEEVQLGVVLPAVPDRPQGQDHLAQPLDRRDPLHAEAALVVTFDLGAQTQNEAACGVGLQIPADIGEHHRAAREGDCHAGAKLDALRLARSHDQREERVMAGLGAPQPIEPYLLGPASGLGGSVERGREECGINFHRDPLSEAYSLWLIAYGLWQEL